MSNAVVYYKIHNNWYDTIPFEFDLENQKNQEIAILQIFENTLWFGQSLQKRFGFTVTEIDSKKPEPLLEADIWKILLLEDWKNQFRFATHLKAYRKLFYCKFKDKNGEFADQVEAIIEIRQ